LTSTTYPLTEAPLREFKDGKAYGDFLSLTPAAEVHEVNRTAKRDKKRFLIIKR